MPTVIPINPPISDPRVRGRSTMYSPLLWADRARLLEVLDGLGLGDWLRPTPCPGWRVLDLMAHVLGDDLGFLAGHRDGHVGAPTSDLVDEGAFIDWLDELQDQWVLAARRLSPRLVVELLLWTGPQVAAAVSSEDPTEIAAAVSWASTEPVPRWLDHARELSERWIHRQQLLDALGRPSDLRPDLAGPVLDGLRWAYPHRLDVVDAPSGTTVAIGVTGPEVRRSWVLERVDDGWRFAADLARDRAAVPAASVTVSTDQAWRLLTNNLDPVHHGRPQVSGDPAIVDVLLATRAIIGHPRPT